MKKCKECKHHEKDLGGFSERCTWFRTHPAYARYNDFWCGKGARRFEAKPTRKERFIEWFWRWGKVDWSRTEQRLREMENKPEFDFETHPSSPGRWMD